MHGERLYLGNATLAAIHTPGHTNESTSYLLNESALFTGDTLFTNGVGRPGPACGPVGDAATRRPAFTSVNRLRQLRGDICVLPAHASEPIPFDGRPVTAKLHEVARWLNEWIESEPNFVERVTSNLPPTPANFDRIVELNEAGELPTGDPTDLEAGANRCAVR